MNLLGKKFGRLQVLRKVPSHNNSKSIYWLCKCDCGKEVEVRGSALTSGHTKSCGCYLSDRIIENNYKHGGYGTRLYHIWCGMKKRCYDCTDKDYKNYGERGIKICNEWLDDFEIFQKWALNNGYQEDLTIDRINVNGNYEPSNCRWATTIEQSNNKRNNKLITIANRTMTMTMWAKERNINKNTVQSRLRSGWTELEALEFVERKKK